MKKSKRVVFQVLTTPAAIAALKNMARAHTPPHNIGDEFALIIEAEERKRHQATAEQPQ